MAKITKITIEIGKKKIELTADEAKELRESLNSVFTDHIPYPVVQTSAIDTKPTKTFWFDAEKFSEKNSV